ncbi:MAG TPA: STAS domain-containing protein [Candidatus Dormibacteraeota bacterium]
MNTTFAVGVRGVEGGMVVALTGDIDGSASAALSEAYQRGVEENNPERVLLDFTATDYINSSGIAAIVSVLAQARAQHRPVLASGLSDHYREIFEITRLSDFIELHGDVDEAVTQIRQASR